MRFTTRKTTSSLSLQLQLLDMENGSVDIVAFEDSGFQYVLGTFEEGRLYLNYFCSDQTQLLNLERHDNAMYLSVKTIPPPP